jgi:hypothetical protein
MIADGRARAARAPPVVSRIVVPGVRPASINSSLLSGTYIYFSRRSPAAAATCEITRPAVPGLRHQVSSSVQVIDFMVFVALRPGCKEN